MALTILQELSVSRSDQPLFAEWLNEIFTTILSQRYSKVGLLLRNTDVCSKRQCHPQKMNTNDLATIEQFLDRSLPNSYRALMLNYPLDSSDFNSQIALYDDPQRIISYNKTLREGEFADHWSTDRLTIGCSPCGDAYFLDLTGASPAVFARDHETLNISEEASDLAAFIVLQKSYEEQWRNRKQIATRPWWKFW